MKKIFNQKIEATFRKFQYYDPTKYPKHEKKYYADFVELLALCDAESDVTFADVHDRLFGVRESPKEEDGQTGSLEGQMEDNNEVFVGEIFKLIEERANLYQDDYPFNYTHRKIKLKDNVTFKNKLYISLLLSSSLDILGDFQKELSDEFETLCFHALKDFLPDQSQVREFGQHTTYKGNAKSKIRQLADELKLPTESDELEEIPERNTKERGLDVVGWIPFDDDCQNKLVFLGQCTCGKDTNSKYHDVKRFENYIRFYRLQPILVLFTCYSLINTSKNKFYKSADVEKRFLIFERKRIIQHFKEETVFNSLELNNIVNSYIKFQEGIV